jgi:sulfate adenylyltransferase (ADP) / ATP adenylyltransferase
VISLSTVTAATERALASGALQPISTDAEVIEDEGVRFVVRIASSLERKAAPLDARAEPLGDYEPDLFVAELSSTHYVLLNKFNVLPHHLLIVTRRFEPQEAPLSAGDFGALSSCLAQLDWLGFYNAGRDAGASQARKHLQLVPLPEIPIEPFLAAGGSLPFEHAFAPLAPRSDLHAAYRDLLRWDGPYNVLVTRRWMLVVPRSREHFQSISVNALGFAGSLFVRNRAELELVRKTGPMKVLREVGTKLVSQLRG